MDIFAMTRKRRPSRLTMAPTSLQLNPEPALQRPLPIVTGPPSQYHWKHDRDGPQCAHPNCSRKFGLFERRHHCRKCGDIYCSLHCSNYLRLDQNSDFHPEGYLSRGCDLCAAEWQNVSLSLAAISGNDSTLEKKHKHPRSRQGIMTLQPHALEGVLELGRDDIVQQEEHTSDPNGVAIANINKRVDVFDAVASTVPADWQWSTF
ncbi:hypothetical protein DM01DRAFT_1377108 [Hesseltinella vesiculosa]|uniref:FYVE-type domain-containing protein n=1 Tax=Hesseltinella vesiculosa TaxID=101127 RepID=A0A1X2G8I3_9FUNG|nr:hypothetical protein DM01DRAFT_1377108 [Hesseltinella vesiculosa]